MKKSPHVTVAEYVSQQITMSGKAQKDIAAELNYDKPNIITMIKQGKTKIPMDKITEFAKALEVDQIHFLRIVMREYWPRTWAALEETIGSHRLVSESEVKLLEIIREASQGIDVMPKSDDERNELRSLVAKWSEREISLGNASLASREK